MRIAERPCGSWPTAFMRLKFSRQEIPASTRMRVLELLTMAQFPRLPDASTETETPMCCSIPFAAVQMGVTLWLSGTFERLTSRFQKSECSMALEWQGLAMLVAA